MAIVLKSTPSVKYAAEIVFDGTRYHGWQRQDNALTVQDELEYRLHVLLGQPVEVTGCGRTDTGVHARKFIVHFETETIPGPHFDYKLNSILPQDIAVVRLFRATHDFNARFSAIRREYRYFMHHHKDPFLHGRSYFFHRVPDLERMNAACTILLEHTDFASFCKSGANSKTTICHLKEAQWHRAGEQTVFTISADRFLRNMVRAIVGTMLDVGYHKTTLEQFRDIIEQRSRAASGTSVPACGLYLWDVAYPEGLLTEM